MNSILIKNTMAILPAENGAAAKNCSVRTENGKIAAILPPDTDAAAARVIDGRDKLLIPGLVNAHTHVYMTGMRCYADDLKFDDWLFGRVMPKEDAMTPEDAYWFSLLGCMEMLSGGVTAYLDMHMFPGMSARAALETGMRAVLSRGLSGGGDDAEGGARRLREAKAEISEFGGEALLSFMLGPHAPYTCTEDYLREVADAARELNVGIHTHLSETAGEVGGVYEQHGCSPIEYFDRLGLLTSRTVAAHCVHLSENDIDLLAQRGVYVASNPASNMKLANGFAPIPEMLEKGVKICLGTDSTASNNSLSILREMALVSLIHKGRTCDEQNVTAQETFRMATKTGSEALGLDGGEIAVGRNADLVLFDLKQPGLTPLGDAVAALSYASQGLRADTVLVDGKVVLEGGAFPGIDAERVYYEVNKACKRLGM